MNKVDIIFVLSVFHVDTIRFNIIYGLYYVSITENVKIRTERILPDYQSQAF